jgi:FAD:protein FMN transferase
MLNVKHVGDRSNKISYLWFAAMHTRVDIVICGLTADSVELLGNKIFEKITTLGNMMNRFNPDSELSGLNLKAAYSETKVSEDLFSVIDYSLKAYESTNGLFDITIQSPNRSGFEATRIKLNHEKLSICFNLANIKIDLGGIAKGYAVDSITALLKNNDATDFLVNMGNSSVSAYGNQPFGNGWCVSLHDNSQKFILHNECLSVSGNSHLNPLHIIHPATNEYIDEGKVCTVICKTAIEGEVASTVKFIKSSVLA